MIAFQRISNILFIFVLCFVLLGGFYYQYTRHEQPCPLCLLQRLGMIGVAVSLLMNLRFGIHVQYYGLAILNAVLALIVALRQISMHICTDFPSFGEPILGYDLYVWSFIVFVCSIVACSILMILYDHSKEHPVIWGRPEKWAFGFVVLIILANIVTTFLECGLTSCV